MNAITTLIERMDQAPTEFAVDASWRCTRWEYVTDIVVAESTMSPNVFTKEEIDAYMGKLGRIVRAQLEDNICIEILDPLSKDKKASYARQMELFHPALVGGGGTKSHQDNFVNSVKASLAQNAYNPYSITSPQPPDSLQNDTERRAKSLGLGHLIKKTLGIK
jgi:hypothetical protein